MGFLLLTMVVHGDIRQRVYWISHLGIHKGVQVSVHNDIWQSIYCDSPWHTQTCAGWCICWQRKKGLLYSPWRTQTCAGRCTCSGPAARCWLSCRAWLPRWTWPGSCTHPPGTPCCLSPHASCAPEHDTAQVRSVAECKYHMTTRKTG